MHQVGECQNVVKVGIVLPFTGSLAPIGKSCFQGSEFAVNEINTKGGIRSLNGAKLMLVKGDSEGKPEVGMSEVERISREGVVAFFGAYQSAVTFAVTQVAERQKMPWIVPISIADNITDRGFKFTFRINNKSSEYIPRTLEMIHKLIEHQKVEKKPITMAMLYENTLYGQSLNKDIKNLSESGELLKKYNLKLVDEASYPHTTSSLSTELTKLKSANPDLLFAVSYISDAILLARTMQELKFNVMGIYITGGGFGDDQLIKSLGKTSEYVLGSEHWAPGKHPDLNGRFMKQYGVRLDGNAVKYYAGMYVLKDALEKATSTDRNKIRDALAKTRLTDHVLPFDAIEFDQTGHNPNVYQVIDQIRDGKYQTIFPTKYSSIPPVFPVPRWENRN